MPGPTLEVHVAVAGAAWAAGVGPTTSQLATSSADAARAIIRTPTLLR